MAADDQVLLERWARHRDPEAFRQISSRYAQMVYATCRRILRNEAQAEEVAQDCFVALIRSGTKPGRSLGPWLHRVATNLALKRIRSESRRRDRELRYGSGAAAQHHEGAGDVIAAVDEAIAALPEAQRAAVVAYFLEGRTHEEIAQVYGITRQAAGHRVKRGIQSVRDAIEKRGIALGVGGLDVVFAESKTWKLPQNLSSNLGKLALSAPREGAVRGALGTKAIAAAGSIAALITIVAIVFVRGAATTPTSESYAESAADSDTVSASVSAINSASLTPPPGSATGRVDTEPKTETPATEPLEPRTETPPDREYEPAASSVAVLVLDSRGFGVPDATITVLERNPSDNLFSASNEGRVVRTASDGTAIVDGIEASEAYVSASATGYRTASRKLSPAPGERMEVTLQLADGFTLVGNVRDSGGSAVAGAIVQPLGYASDYGHGSGGDDIYNIAVTGADGTFELGFVREGQAALKITAPNHTARVFTNVIVVHDSPVQFVLDAPASLSGRITDRNGSPLAGLTVKLDGRFQMDLAEIVPSAGQLIDGESDYLSTVTDANGRYAFSMLATNAQYLIQVRDSTWRELSARVDLGVFDPGDARVWDHALDTPIRVYGSVAGEQTGVAIRNVRVSYYKDEQLHEGPYLSGEESYELRLFEAGEYYIFPEYNSWSRDMTVDTYGVTVSLRPGEERELNFRLPDQFTMSVRVIDPEGRPIEGANCDWKRITPRGHGMYGSGRTDSEGRYSNAFVPELESWFFVSKEGYTSVHSTHITGEPGAVYPEETVVLYPTGGIEGTALDRNGITLANAELKVALRADDVRVSYNSSYPIDTLQVTSDAAGWFAIGNGLPATAGDVHIWVHLDNNEWVDGAVVPDVRCVTGHVADLGEVRLDVQ